MKEGDTTTSSRFPQRKRINIRISYRWNNRTPICQETYLNFESSNPGVVKVQEFANGEFIEFSLWKDKDKIAESIEEIRNLIFPILTPEPLKPKRREYLYKNIFPLVGEKFREEICPVPR